MKLYVVVRSDMSKSQQAVQAGHALAELLINKNVGWKNGTLIYLSVKNEKQLRKYYKQIKSFTRNHAAFCEPFWDDSMTAFAAYGRNVSDALASFPLL